jgi:hypothetical protein
MSMDPRFTPRNLSASDYVLELFEPSENVAILVRNRVTRKTVQRITRAETVSSPDFQDWLTHENVTGADIFVGMNPIKDGAYSRTKDSIQRIRHVYLDLDRDGSESLRAIRNSIEVPAPNFVLNTSPGKHQVAWKVSGLSQNEAESLLRRLAGQFGGDPAATDSTRVLRLPGFANRKLPGEFIVQACQETAAVYTLRDFALREDSPETPRHLARGQEPKRMLPDDHKSQSEHDWSYAKRALARGDDPEVVIRRIADYRGDEKHPSYARYTVKKAQIELEQNRSTNQEISHSSGDM